MSKKNKFYMVYEEDMRSECTNIVIAKTAKKAKVIGSGCQCTDGCDFIEVRVQAIKAGQTFWKYDGEGNKVTIEVGGKGYLYTDLEPQFDDFWDKFYEELRTQKRYEEVDQEDE